MGTKYDFDYIIIGSGPAGLTSAIILAKARKRVALVEGKSLGGANVNTRDIPFSEALKFSHAYHQLLSHPAVHGQALHYNLPTLSAHQDRIISHLTETYTKLIQDHGITLIPGYAHFLDEHTIAVGGNNYTATTFIIATGAHLKATEISGLDQVNYLTPDTALRPRRLPKFIVVAGGGPTGVEIASFYAELGVKTMILERSSRLLPREDKEASSVVTDHLVNDLGVIVITNARLVALEQDQTSKIVIFTEAGHEKMVRTDTIALATGSEPSLDLGLENAGVKYKRTGIIVDKFFTTSAKNIFAIGDATGTANSSTPRAEYEARVLTSNLLNKSKTTPSFANSTRLIDTTPLVATVGLNEKDLLARDQKSKHHIIKLTTLNQFDDPTGFIKVHTDPAGHILGATIVSRHASALAKSLALAISHRLTISDLQTIFVG